MLSIQSTVNFMLSILLQFIEFVELQEKLKYQFPSEIRTQMREGKRRKKHMLLPGERSSNSMPVQHLRGRQEARDERRAGEFSRQLSYIFACFLMLLAVLGVIVIGLVARFVIWTLLQDLLLSIGASVSTARTYADIVLHYLLAILNFDLVSLFAFF